jgi:hypothetical protein
MECVSDVDFIVTGSVFMPVTKVPRGPRENPFHVTDD